VRLAVLLHAWPPEQLGGTELSTRRLVHALVSRGHEVLVLAGTLEFSHPPSVRRRREVEPVTGRPYTVALVERSDPYFDHWQKHRCPGSTRAVLDLLREHRIEVLHLQHWLRSSSDIVRRAALQGVPTVASLHDHATTCLLGWRVHPVERRACERVFDPLGCARCAAQVPPFTPWKSLDQQAVAAGERAAAFEAELAATARVLVPSLAHGELLVRMGLEVQSLLTVPPLVPVHLRRAEPLPAPGPGRPLRIGAWGLSDEAKGGGLLREAARRLEGRVELVLAGHAAGEAETGVEVHGAYTPGDLAEHPVTQVHAAASGTIALESFGLVASEAQALGLPLVLPLAGAFSERFSEGEGVLFYEQGSAAGLAAVLERLASEDGLLTLLRRRLPPVEEDEGQVIEFLERLYQQVADDGPPAVEAPAWYEDRMAELAAQAWDDEVKRRTRADLGFQDEGGA
jgi:glycosyltransferase involved in cell wall biosynthesis